MDRKFFLMLVAVVVMLFNLTACDVIDNSELSMKNTDTTLIYFSDGSYKEYECNSVIDPFKELEVTFSGEPDKGVAEIDISNCPDIVKENFTFRCIGNGNLSNGEKAIIVVDFEKNAFEKAGFTIIRSENEYIVTDVDFYPRIIADYDKDDLNKAIRNVVDEYIKNNIESFKMVYKSDIERVNWSKSGSFEYTYKYYDVKMIYNVNKNNLAQNTYLIMYEITNNIKCIEDMDSIFKDAMKKGETDTGVVYMVAGVNGVTANSNKIFNDNITTDNVKSNIKLFYTKEEAEEYCRFGGEYETNWEHFV